MPYVAGRHITYNGKVYERGEVVDVTEETLGRIESYLSTKTLVFMEKLPKKKAAPAPEPVIESLVEEPAEEVAEEPETLAEVIDIETLREPQIVALNVEE